MLGDQEALRCELRRLDEVERSLEAVREDAVSLHQRGDEAALSCRAQHADLARQLTETSAQLSAGFRAGLGAADSALRELCLDKFESVSADLASCTQHSRSMIHTLREDFLLSSHSLTAASKEILEFKETQNYLSRGLETINERFDSFQDLNAGNIDNLKQALKNNENQMTINDKDVKNQMIFLENKLRQKVFTPETMEKIESRFSALENFSSNEKIKTDDLKTRFEDFKVCTMYHIVTYLKH